MQKIGILTLNGYFNYGNRLQNYALQEVLESFGFSVDTIIVDRSKSSHTNQKRNTKIQSLTVKIALKKTLKLIKSRKNGKYERERIERFKRFTKKYIFETDFSISQENIPNDLSRKYDYFVIGSDQVWNPHMINGSSIFFATFSPKEKRVAFSPSFGISAIPEEFKEKYTQWLNEMNYLSVREEAGSKIIKNLTGRNVAVLIDPTLMLSKEKWVSISKPDVNKPKKGYLLTYFLGKVSKEYNKKIKQIALNNNLEIVNLASMNDKLRYGVDPGEFIDYINSASVFLTDSFHGCVFSILLEKPFIVFDRVGTGPTMNSRINTLLSTFNLESRQINQIKENEEIFNVDYNHIPEILEFERNKANEYLKKALKTK